jgi:predicted transcriptional regulator
MGGGLRRIYELLDEPRTTVELRQTLGVTRQAVGNALKILMEAGN